MNGRCYVCFYALVIIFRLVPGSLFIRVVHLLLSFCLPTWDGLDMTVMKESRWEEGRSAVSLNTSSCWAATCSRYWNIGSWKLQCSIFFLTYRCLTTQALIFQGLKIICLKGLESPYFFLSGALQIPSMTPRTSTHYFADAVKLYVRSFTQTLSTCWMDISWCTKSKGSISLYLDSFLSGSSSPPPAPSSEWCGPTEEGGSR